MCECTLCVYRYPGRVEQGVGSPEAGVKSSCRLTNVSVGNQASALNC